MNKKIRNRLITALSCLVVFVTTYALILPAITLSSDKQVLSCHYAVHQHTKACYYDQPVYDSQGRQTGTQKVLICSRAEFVAHEHDANCYQDGQLVCMLPEIKPHVHDQHCYRAEQQLICTQPETNGHTHSDACYQETQTLVCTAAEHVHSSACYENVSSVVGRHLICGYEEGAVIEPAVWSDPEYSEAVYDPETGEVIQEAQLIRDAQMIQAEVVHHHTDACYVDETETESRLVCGLQEHTHNAACYWTDRALICGMAEAPAHRHGASCYTTQYVLICNEPEIHTHTMACFETGPKGESPEKMGWAWYYEDENGQRLVSGDPNHMICNKYELLVHQHGPECFEAAPAPVETEAYAETQIETETEIETEIEKELIETELIETEPIETEPIETEPIETEPIETSEETETDIDPTQNVESEIETETEIDIETVAETETAVETETAIETETEAETETETAAQEASAFDLTVPVHGAAYWLDIAVTEDCGIPENAVFKATALPENAYEYADFAGKALEAAAEENELKSTGDYQTLALFDLSIYDAEGHELQPQAPISVKILLSGTAADTAGEASELYAVHFPGTSLSEDGRITDAVTEKKLSAEDAATEVIAVTELNGTVSFDADALSVYAVVYTVDIHYEVDGRQYDYTIPGGGFISLKQLAAAVGIVPEDQLDAFIADVADVSFSDPSLLNVIRAEETTTVGALKTAYGLESQYSADLSQAQIDAIDAGQVEAGDWALISLLPFDTEESLTVTMKSGEQFVVKVTDAHEIPDSGAGTISVNKSYLICYEDGGTYYLLKNDGSVDSSHTPDDFENLNSTYCWSFNYVFEEKHLDETLTYIYYLIRPIDNRAKTIALNAEGQDLVQRSNNNVAVVPAEGGGFNLIGYNEVKLNFDGTGFFADELPANDNGIVVHIYEMDTLPTYTYTARSSDSERGTVTITGGTPKTDADGSYVEAESNSDKMNAGVITAVPVDHRDTGGDNKWIFDHWTQDGVILDRDQYPAEIAAESLPIPYNGSNLVAYFKQNKNYDVPDDEKQPTSIEDMSDWLDQLAANHVPLDENATAKTAEIYDYENRIYRVDIASKANFRTFKGNVDMAFCMDVSNSMYFPSKLVEHRTLNIYQINNSWNNKNWLDTSRGWNNPYYLIADQANTATVFKIYYQDGNWKAQDASRETESDRSFRIGDNFQTNWAGYGTHPFNAGDTDYSSYMIYNAGDYGRNRFYYLNQAFSDATGDLLAIKNLLEVAGDESPDVRVAYNTFNLNLGAQRQDFQTVTHITGLDLSNSHGGGTRPDQSFIDAQTFDWDGDDRYVILITDGAPQGQRTGETDNNFERISQAVKDEAQFLKDYGGVKFITIGLSMDKVPHGKKLLYDLADEDDDDNKMFFMAESASDLPDILRQVIDTIMDDAIVLAEVTDTVGEAFYPVDKLTGQPLQPNDMIDLEGCLTYDPLQAAGIVQEDGRTIKWIDADIDNVIGWHGTIYVKAKEDLLGGNAVETNSEAEIKAEKYKMGEKEYSFDDSLIGDKLKSLEIGFDSPRVNINELVFHNEASEWTVYLGTEVDPKAQLKQMYEDIYATGVINEDGSLHYPIAPNSIEDDRTGGEHGTAQTFPIAPLILDLISEDPALASRYLNGDELDWDTFLTDIQRPNGVVVPYHVYGVEGDDSNITITLTKEILPGEETDLVNASPHETTVVNGEGGSVPVEKYTLTVQYNPDYDHVLPVGQGGKNPNAPNYQTGIYGSMYQGHASGRETSTNTHEINVYQAPLDIYKTDASDNPLAGATFKLYQVDDTNGTDVEGLKKDHKYVEAASATSGNDGSARFKNNGEDYGLILGETYYLIEDSAPEGYTKSGEVRAVEVQTEIGKFTDLDGEPIYSTLTPPPPVGTGVTDDMYPFNWDQGARIMLDGSEPVTVIAKGETEGSETQITDGSFVSHDRVISFRHTILNLGGLIDIDVHKTWEDENHPPESVTVKLYRVSEKDHHWDEGTVIPCTCTAEGVTEYTCSECGKTETHVINPAGHTPGTPHHENETAATCSSAGGYDTVVRCIVCNAIISSEHTDIGILEHTPGEPKDENVVIATCTEDGGYDTVVRCTACDLVLSSEHHTLPATGHVWGDWVVTTPARPGVAGEETRICERDHTHVETRPIDPLPTNHTVTIYFRCTGNGNGGQDYYGQITSIATRSGTGAGDMTIEWDWNRYTQPQPFDVDGLVGGSTYSTYSTRDGAEYQPSSGNGQKQHLTIRNITQDLTIYITIRNNNYDGTNSNLIYWPTFTGIPNRTMQAASMTLGKTAAAAKSVMFALSDSPENPLLTGDQLRAGEDDADAGNDASMSQAQLEDYLNSLVSKDEATCEEADDAVHIYKEEVGTYTITPDANGHWTLPIEDLPKYNPYGKEYSYYILETSPVSGYEITYTGQDSGVQSDSEVTINNKKLLGSLEITKTVLKNHEADTAATGTFYYGVYDGPYDEAPLPTRVAAGSIAVSGGSGSATVPALPYGSYYVYELTEENGTPIISGADGVRKAIGGTVYLVTGSGIQVTISETAAAAAFTNDKETVNVSVKKDWIDNDNADGNRPAQLKVWLSNGAEVILNSSNNWTATISDLPKYNAEGQLIAYTWTEDVVGNGYAFIGSYTDTVPGDGGVDTEITTLRNGPDDHYNPLTRFFGTKTWDDDGTIRPDELTVTLYKMVDGQKVAVASTTLEAPAGGGNTWTYEFTNIPIFDEDGNAIEYFVEETLPDGYVVSVNEATSMAPNYERDPDNDSVTVNEPNAEMTISTGVNLGFIVMKHGNSFIIWTPRKASDAEIQTIKEMVAAADNLIGDQEFNQILERESTNVYGVPNYDITKGNMTASIYMDGENVLVDFGNKRWSQLAWGQLAYTYTPGNTDLINTQKDTGFDFSKKWVGLVNDELEWDQPIEVTLFRKKADGTQDQNFSLVYDIPKEAVVNGNEILSRSDLQHETANDPKLKVTVSMDAGIPHYSFGFDKLPYADEDHNKYTYFVRETNEQLAWYLEPRYANTGAPTGSTEAYDHGEIINQEMGGVELPSTGGPGTTLIYLLGIILAGMAGAGLMLKRIFPKY